MPFIPATILHFGLIFPEKKENHLEFPFIEYLIYVPAILIGMGYEIYIATFRNVILSGIRPFWVPTYDLLISVNRPFNIMCPVTLFYY